MLTGVYYPKDTTWLMDNHHMCVPFDASELYNRGAELEPPSYCVRLMIFDYEDCVKSGFAALQPEKRLS